MRTSWDAWRSLNRFLALVLGEVDADFEVRPAFEEVALRPPFAVVDRTGDERTLREGSIAVMQQQFTIDVYPRGAGSAFVEPNQSAAEVVKLALWEAFELGITYSDVTTELGAPEGLSAAAQVGGTLGRGYRYYRVTAVDEAGESYPSGQVEVLVPSGGLVELEWDAVAGAESYRVWSGRTPGQMTSYQEVDDPEFDDTGSTGIVGFVPEPIRSGARRVPLYDYDGVSLDEGSFARNPHDFLLVDDHQEQVLADPVDPRAVRVVVSLRLSWRRLGRRATGRVATEPGRLTFRF